MHHHSEVLPCAGLAACLAAGILLSGLARGGAAAVLAFGAVLLLCAAAAALALDRLTAALAAAHAAVIIGGMLLSVATDAGRASDAIPFHVSRGLVPLDEPLLFEGCLVGQVREYEDECLLTLDLHGYKKGRAWVRCRGGAYLRIPRSAEEAMPQLSPGDRIRGWATFRRPRDFQNPGSQDRSAQLSRRGIFLAGRVKSARLLEVLPGDCGTAGGSLVQAGRDRLRRSLDGLRCRGREREAAVLYSIILGDASWLDQATREAFQNSGTFHVLVVSGLHVAWIAWLLLRILKGLHLHESACRVLVVLSIVAYASIVGRQASISRALWMYALCAVGQALHRKGHSANIALASAFILIALSPEWLYDIGFQLSFLSVLAITLTGMPLEYEFLRPVLGPSTRAGIAGPPSLLPGTHARIGRRLLVHGELLAEAIGDRWRPWAERLTLSAWRMSARGALAVGSMVLVSVSVQLWIEPVLAGQFNRLSWVAALANLALVPLSSAILAVGGLGALVAGMIPGTEGILAPAAALSELLVYAASALAELPGAWMRCPTPPPPWVLGLLAVVSAWFIVGWRWRWVPSLLSASLLAVLACAPAPGWAVPGAGIPEGWVGQPLCLTFLDVGQGDSAVVRFPDSRVWVVDAGGTQMAGAEENGPPRFDVGESVVSRYLWYIWARRLDRLLLSHPHHDHGGGMPALLRNFNVGDLVHGEAGADPLLARILATAKARGVISSRAAAGRRFEVGRVRLHVLFPSQDRRVAPSNDQSLVLQLTLGRFSALLTGDVERTAEAEIVERHGRTLRSPLLKVAHHGSRTSTTDALLREVRPRWAVISAGRHNPFGEPSREVVLRLARGGALPLLTMDHGAITLETDGERYVLRSFRNGVLDAGPL